MKKAHNKTKGRELDGGQTDFGFMTRETKEMMAKRKKFSIIFFGIIDTLITLIVDIGECEIYHRFLPLMSK